MDNRELMHYGVMGMKWGVRRYQNKDGSLTAKGKKRFADVSMNERKSRRQSKQAVSLLYKKGNEARTSADINVGRANTAYRKASKYVWKSEAAQVKGNRDKFEKYQGKAWKQLAKQHEYLQAAESFTKQSRVYDQKISDISSGKIKAGRDFIVQTDYNVGALPVPGGAIVGVSRERRLIERKR